MIRKEADRLATIVYSFTQSGAPHHYTQEVIRLGYERLTKRWWAQIIDHRHDYLRGYGPTPEGALEDLLDQGDTWAASKLAKERGL